ncbi:MAG: hypothetical protein DRH04_10310, partial [Deltaproteobacteria bacterium]
PGAGSWDFWTRYALVSVYLLLCIPVWVRSKYLKWIHTVMFDAGTKHVRFLGSTTRLLFIGMLFLPVSWMLYIYWAFSMLAAGCSILYLGDLPLRRPYVLPV